MMLFSPHNRSVYEQTIVVTNVTSVGRRLRLLPPSGAQFSAPPPSFKGETGLLAPGKLNQNSIHACHVALAQSVLTLLLLYACRFC
jgi:hypothetical protein